MMEEEERIVFSVVITKEPLEETVIMALKGKIVATTMDKRSNLGQRYK